VEGLGYKVKIITLPSEVEVSEVIIFACPGSFDETVRVRKRQI
jgi:hypothetical protein